MKTEDPAIAWIREVRHRISEEHGHDPSRIVNYYMELEKQYGDRLIGRSSEEHRGQGPLEPAIDEAAEAEAPHDALHSG